MMKEVQNDSRLVAELFDEQPQPAFWMKPVWDESTSTIIDWEYRYCNEEMLQYTGLPREQVIGKRLSDNPLVSDDLKKKFINQLTKVYSEGQILKDAVYNIRLNKYYSFIRTKTQGGILTIMQDRTDEYNMIQELEEKTRLLEEQRKFLNSVLDASLNGIFTCKAICDDTGKIIDFGYIQVNNAFTRMMGLSAEQVVGRTMKELFPGIEEQGFFELYSRVIETGEPIHTERCYQGAGLNNWYDLIAVKKGEQEAVITFSDITKQKRTTLDMERQRILLDNVLKYSPTGITVTEVIRDPYGNIVDGRTVIVNEAAERFTGIPKELYTSKSIRELDPNIMSSPLFKMSVETLQTGHPFHTQYFFEPTGRWLELSVAKMDEDHLINVFMDVTDTKESQLRQEKLVQELERTNANLQEFAYAASHDLKEPVRKIILFSERLKHRLNSCMSEDDSRLFGRMENSAERMGILVDDLLQFSQVNQQTSLYEEVDLNNKLRLVLEDLEVLIEEKHAKITIGPLPTIRGHRRQLQQLFQNLIGNALKYNKPGVPPEITISSRTVTGGNAGFDLPKEEMDKEFYLIEVSDNGIGFAQEDAERIFNLFQRLHGKAEYAGTGIGLAIARKVVQNHNGYISAKGELGKGATFRVLLPV